jgi:ribosomal protein S26
MCQKTIHSILLLFCICSVIFAEIVRIPGLNNSKTRAFSLRFGKRSHIDPSWITNLRLGR